MSGINVVPGGTVVAAGDVDGGAIFCPAGKRVVGGGFFSASADGEVFVSVANDDRTGWIVALDNFDASVEAELSGEAYCAGAGQAIAAGTRSRARSARKLARLAPPAGRRICAEFVWGRPSSLRPPPTASRGPGMAVGPSDECQGA